MGGGGNSTASTTDTAIGNIKVQTAIAGTCIPIVYGRTKVPANLMWYGAFTPIAHVTAQATGGGGGKGGGGQKPTNTTFTYTAACIMGLCEGPVKGVTEGWRDKFVYGAKVIDLTTKIVREDFTIPSNGRYAVSLASVFVAVVEVSDGQSLRYGADYTNDALGNFSFNDPLRGQAAYIRYIVSDTTATPNALTAMGLSLAGGWDSQPTWGYLTTNFPSQAIGYSGIAYLYAPAYDLGADANVGNHNFELSTYTEFSSTNHDAQPAVVVADFLTNLRYGAQWPNAQLGDLTAYETYTTAAGLFMSPALTTQQDAASWLTYFLQLSNSDCVWSEGQIKIRPLGDVALSANGANYTPNTTPVFDIGEDHYLAGANGSPLTPHNKSSTDTFNHVQVEFYDRTNSYNTQIAEWKDDADIATRGLLSMSTVEGHALNDPAVAQLVAALIGQRQIAVARTFSFTLPWTFSLLEPLDLITLTESQLGMLRVPVRINSITENDDYSLEIEAEDCPIGFASAPAYGIQQTIAFTHDYNAEPGNVTTPFLFEPPIELTTSGLEVWCAASGTSANWGGCLIYTSLDNVSYKQTGRIDGGARYGSLGASIGTSSADAIALALAGLGGVILSGSAADAAADQTLLFVGDASGGEYVDYQTATLTGANAYSLTALSRGRYGSAAAPHGAGQTVVRVDGAIGKSDPLDLAMVGRTIFVKLCSFNVYGGGTQSIADVPAYTYTITGAMLKLPPSDVQGLTATFETGGIRFQWLPIPDQDLLDYEIRIGGTSWETAGSLTQINGTNYLWGVQLAGEFTVWIKARDIYGNRSLDATHIVVHVPGPNATNLTAMIVGPNVQLNWSVTTGAYTIDHYLVSMGPSVGDQTVIAAPLSTRFDLLARFLGTQFFGVAAVDVAGNVGPFVYAQVDIVAPSAPTGGNAGHAAQEVIDNNVLLYWQAPRTGTLPIASYDVRKGASYASGASIGSNGNSTFAAVFEQQSGVFTYWIAAVDTAGNVGPALQIVATVSQPPDFILRATVDSVFDGTLVGMYVDDGKVYGPSFGETWDQHFTGRGWSSAQDQIAAGYPLYFEPSANTGSYEEIIDFGALLPGTTITITPTINQLSGATTITVQLSYKAQLSDPWIDATAGATSTFATNFRYVKTHFTFAASGGDDLVELAALNTKLSVKLQNDSGNGHANASDAHGTWVAFNIFFIDAETPRVTPNGKTPLIGICDFADVPDPTGFYVYIFDLAGNRVDADFGWATRGF